MQQVHCRSWNPSKCSLCIGCKCIGTPKVRNTCTCLCSRNGEVSYSSEFVHVQRCMFHVFFESRVSVAACCSGKCLFACGPNPEPVMKKKTERRAPKHLTEVHCSQQAENQKNETNVGQHSWTWHQCCATLAGWPPMLRNIGEKKGHSRFVEQHWAGGRQCCATLAGVPPMLRNIGADF